VDDSNSFVLNKFENESKILIYYIIIIYEKINIKINKYIPKNNQYWAMRP